MDIRLLDCTLRDGGYIIDWMFGEKNIQSILCNLSKSGVDFIECGFLKEAVTEPDKTFFCSPDNLNGANYTLMVNFGEYPIEKFKECKSKNTKIRIAFKKHQLKKALEYIKTLVNMGWCVFANPMNTNGYTNSELDTLINEINKIKPFALAVVDTLGNMHSKQVTEVFSRIDQKLLPEIALGFHSHNNLQLSLSNTKALIKLNLNRTIILDCCIYGMGRGAGNPRTEEIMEYLNSGYDIKPVLEIIEKILNPIYEKTPWGYSTPYYIAAIYGCHPNYARFLIERGMSDEEINKIIPTIPEEKKASFDKEFLLSLIL